MDDLTSARSRDDFEADSAPKKSATPSGMAGRWLAALLGASVASLTIGIAVARAIAEPAQLAVASGGFLAICAWSVLAPAAIAQRSAAKAWALVVGVAALALCWMLWMQWS